MAVSADQPVSVGNLSAVLGSIAGGGSSLRESTRATGKITATS